MCPGRRRTTSGLVLVICAYRRIVLNMRGKWGMPAMATSDATGEIALEIVASKWRLGTRAIMKASLASLGRQSTPEKPGVAAER
jgi:hypothetical protein